MTLLVRTILFSLLIFTGETFANVGDSTVQFLIPDSLKAIQFTSTFRINELGSKTTNAGIRADKVTLSLSREKKGLISFSFPKNANVIASGDNVTVSKKGMLKYEYDWHVNQPYQLLVSTAADSAGQFMLYSGYVFLPELMKWKLIGTCKISHLFNTIRLTEVFFNVTKGNKGGITIEQAWCQRNNGSWKNLLPKESKPPLINLLGHVDSLALFERQKSRIESLMKETKLPTYENLNGIYYRIIKAGEGKTFSVNDTVVVNYKLTLLGDTAIIDQSKDQPAVFPLKRLISGWQIGVPLVKTGGKIALILPSNYAYSIRTRSPFIPPNSILFFDIEVLDARPTVASK